MSEGNAPSGPDGPRVDPGRPVDPKAAELQAQKNPLKRLGKVLGPGLITGASDDDPSGIGAYAQAGAQYMRLQWPGGMRPASPQQGAWQDFLRALRGAARPRH